MAQFGEFFFTQSATARSELHCCLKIISSAPGAGQTHTVGHSSSHPVFFLVEKFIDHTFNLNVQQRVAVGNLDRLHGQLDVFSPFVNPNVAVHEFVPNVRFGRLFPFTVDLNDAASRTAYPRHIFRDRGQLGSRSSTGLAHAVAKQRWLRPANEAKFPSEATAHAHPLP